MQFYGDLTFLGVYLLGLFFIPSWRKKKKEHDWLPWMFGWTVFMFFSYVLYLEIIRGTAFFLIPIAFFGLFALFYFKEKRRSRAIYAIHWTARQSHQASVFHHASRRLSLLLPESSRSLATKVRSV